MLSHFFADLKQAICMPFYGDLLSKHHLQNTLNASTLMPQHWPHFPLLHPVKIQKPTTVVEEHRPGDCNIPHLQVYDALNFNQKLKWLSALSRDIALRDFARLINYFPKLHASLLHKFLVEAYLYLADPHFIQEVHSRIYAQLCQDNTHIILAHSLGTVIAYNLLIQHPELNIARFITLGSPLAFRVIQEHLQQPIQRPAAPHGDWINFYSPDDFLTAFPLSEPPFHFKPAILNRQVQTPVDRPHEVYGYLQHPQVLEALVELLPESA
ncbi:alpha/beta hydrolase [Acinetobacter indicus]|uniref:alpha/beta hydrolase n=1 Tax=Acinetobacter indicus TaxID=756892 RepID=UPI001BC8838A|nr:alpha/beta hydrolase [Acinetobacter indicus]